MVLAFYTHLTQTFCCIMLLKLFSCRPIDRLINRLLPQKDPLAKNECPRNVSPYLVRVHVVWQSADSKIQPLGQSVYRKCDDTDKKQQFLRDFAPNQLVNVLVPVQTCAHYSRQGISLRKNLTR